MKLKTIGVKVAVFIIVTGSIATTTFAAQQKVPIPENIIFGNVTPFWNNISDISPNIYADGRTLYPEVYIAAQSAAAKITGTMYLEKYSLGKWTRVTSWSISGTGTTSLTKSYIGTVGTEYRTRVSVKVGTESAEATSGSCNI